MDIQGGRDAVKKMKEAGNNQGKVVEIPYAGVSNVLSGSMCTVSYTIRPFPRCVAPPLS
jgi:hypothetical protein